jgi:hypothetical protein
LFARKIENFLAIVKGPALRTAKIGDDHDDVNQGSRKLSEKSVENRTGLKFFLRSEACLRSIKAKSWLKLPVFVR